jgi:sialic acid synthase SpsE
MARPEFDIEDRPVGEGHACYVIAEVGANHDRDLGVAHELIEIAARAGADAIKFQTYSGERIYSRKTPRFRYLAPMSDKSPAELLEEISLPREWQRELRDAAREAGIHFFSSPFDLEAIAELDALDVPVLKIASFEIVDVGLIRAAAATGRPLLISTGMATLGEIEDALDAAYAAGCQEVGLMQCTSVYPAPASLANLKAMETMRRAFGVPVGLSDHSEGIAIPVAAAALGAAFVEKHVTLDRGRTGPDHPFALEPNELEQMILGIRDAQAALGDGMKTGPSAAEREEMYALARRSLIVTRDLSAGTVLEQDMLVVKRPGFGIAPKDIDKVLGRRLRIDVEADEILTWDMV